MAKWKSPFFSDIRNKLGENVVFSMWKGRAYMRKYTSPANPNTDAQKRIRDLLRQNNIEWQNKIAAKSDVKTIWNALALPDLISGFNKYSKQALTSRVSHDAGHVTGTPSEVTYTLGFPAQHAALYVEDTTSHLVEVLSAQGTLSGGIDETVMVDFPNVGTVHVWICDERAIHDDDDATHRYASPVAKWDILGVGEIATVCEVTVTAP